MSCLFSSPTDAENFISFNATYIMSGNFTATAKFANSKCEYTVDCDGLCLPIQISVDQTTDFSSCCSDLVDEFGDLTDATLAACFDAPNDSVDWVYGVVVGYDEDVPTDGVNTVTGTVTSFADYLNRKAIHTEQFAAAPLSDVVERILDYYAGVPLALYDVSYVDNKILGPVKGNSILAELANLAQAGYASLFVQVGGVLTIEEWKDHNSPVELVIPPELVVSAKRSSFNPKRPAMVVARGAQVPTFGCGELPFSNSKTGSTNGGVNELPGKSTFCARSGVAIPDGDIKLNNLAASKRDLLNAQIEHSIAIKKKTKKVKEGSMVLELDFTAEGWVGPSCKEFDIQVYGYKRQDSDKDLTDNQKEIADKKNSAGRYWVSPLSMTRFRAAISGYPVPNNSFGGSFGDSAENTGENSSYSAVQPSFSQVEINVVDPDLSACGNTVTQIANSYVYQRENLFNIAVRRFQEVKLEENTWNVEVAYIPCIKLNQVVTFTVPEKEGCPTREITGIVMGVNVSKSDADAPVTMKIVVSDLSCIGNTTYNSGNLIDASCGGANSAAVNPWVSSAIGLDGTAGADGEIIWIYSNGIPMIMTLNQGLTIGHDYLIEFDYTYVYGYNKLRFAHPNVPGGEDLIGTGTFSDTFTATGTTFPFGWALPLAGYTGLYKVTNVSLTKSIIA